MKDYITRQELIDAIRATSRLSGFTMQWEIDAGELMARLEKPTDPDEEITADSKPQA